MVLPGVVLLGFAGYHVITQGTNSLAIDAGQFVTFFLAMIVAYQPVRALANLNASLQQGMAAAERVFSIIDYKPSIVSKRCKTLHVTEGEVKFVNVEFAYEDEKAAFKNIDIRIPAGKTVALVGRPALVSRRCLI